MEIKTVNLELNNSTLEKYFLDIENSKLTNPEMLKIFKAAVNTHKFSENSTESMIERNLVGFATLSSIYQMHVEVDNEKVFQFGIELVKLKVLTEYYLEFIKTEKIPSSSQIQFFKIKELKIREADFSIYCVFGKKNDRKIFIFCVVPLRAEIKNLLETDIVKFILNFYTEFPVKSKSKRVKLFDEFRSHLNKSIKAYNYKGAVNGVIAHFIIEDLKVYYERMGEEFTAKMIKEIKLNIQKYLKEFDLLYIMNRRSYLVFLPDCNIKTVSSRFADVFFRIDQLIIKFKLDFYEIKEENLKDADFIDKILSSEFRLSSFQ